MTTVVKRSLEDCGHIEHPTGSGDISQMVLLIDTMIKEIKLLYKKNQSLNLVCRGSSGAIIAGIILYNLHLDKRIVRISHVKKPGEWSHQNHIYLSSTQINIIVDDFMSSGDTLNAIHEAMIDTDTPFDVDLLILGGTVNIDKLEFQPNNIICGHLSGSQYDVNIIQ